MNCLQFSRSCSLGAVTAACVIIASPAAAIDFAHDVLPILKTHCAKCHTNGKYEGGFSMDTRRMLLEGEVVVVGNSNESGLIERVLSSDPEEQMPPKGKRLAAAEVKILRDWIDGDLTWERGFTFREFPQAPLEPRVVALPPATAASPHPIDRLLSGYLAKNKITPTPLVDDRTFARRVYLDLNGLLPPVDQVEAFVADSSPDKRDALVDQLLGHKKAYTEHWLTFWSDMLRNAYRGTGFIDGGRARIDKWLYMSLYENKRYDAFVHELITGSNGSAGFINGIKWRGNVNESQRREMQAAQNVAQVFMGTNLKCASCHDSFVNQWKLADSYALASVFADKPLELHRCDKPTGTAAQVAFIYPQLGTIDAKAPRAEKMKQLADIVVQPKNGRLARTIVNRLWAHFMGRGIVESVDDMDQPPFSADLLDWLAEDLTQHDYNLQRTMQLICTSRSYQSQSIGAPNPGESEAIFCGPIVKRMNAEMFADVVSALTSDWLTAKAVAQIPKLDGTAEPQVGVRAALLNEDSLTRALGRPNREQVVTHRESVATTLQAIEMTNGTTLDTKLRKGATHWLKQYVQAQPEELIDNVYLTALGRLPTDAERAVAIELIGEPATNEGVADLLWALTMLPEFQLIH